jgi:hypothetical protein
MVDEMSGLSSAGLVSLSKNRRGFADQAEDAGDIRACTSPCPSMNGEPNEEAFEFPVVESSMFELLVSCCRRRFREGYGERPIPDDMVLMMMILSLDLSRTAV